MVENRFRERRSAFSDEKQEEAEIAPTTTTAEALTAEPPSAPSEEPGPDALEDIDLPEASFLEIVQYFAIQAIQFLGEMPLNEGGERRVMPREAKHFIDLLGILEERTRGNLSDEESRFLEQILTDLRMRYLQVGA
ncbi:hypothetical protein BH18GEM1_BH18GEM1_01960 [soil metagenome]